MRIAVAFLALAALALLGPTACKKHAVATGPKPKLELYEVDDTSNPLASASLAPPVTKDTELVDMTSETYAQAEYAEGESPKRAERELRAAVAGVPLPTGRHFGFGQAFHGSAVRTYLLRDTPIITEADIESATASRSEIDGSWSVMVTLSSKAATTFEAFTARKVNSRIAIVVEDVIQSVPVIKSAIPGGKIQITLGSGPSANEAEAKRLAAGFGGDP